jgi:hypothetical protein
VGTFEFIGVTHDEERDGTVIRGLAVVTMLHNTMLGLMVLMGQEEGQ